MKNKGQDWMRTRMVSGSSKCYHESKDGEKEEGGREKRKGRKEKGRRRKREGGRKKDKREKVNEIKNFPLGEAI